MTTKRELLFTIFITLSLCYQVVAQKNSVRWLSFEQLEDSLAIKQKKVFIDFYADWCAYCKKMDKAAFKDAEVVATLNQEYYAVKMNAETNDTITFGGDDFINDQRGKKRNPTHQIPLLLASREDIPFSLPAIVLLDKKFKITNRYFEYLSPKQLLKAIKKK